MAFNDFEYLQTLPNFQKKPQYSDYSAQQKVNIAPAKNVVSWSERQVSKFNLEFVFLTTTEQRNFLKFFNDRAGRHECFWVPSWQRDLHVTEGIEDGSSELTIIDTEFNTGWNPTLEGDPGYYLFIYSRAEGLNQVKVQSFTATTITLTNPLDFTDSNAIVGFIYLARFDQDEITLKAFAPGKSITDVSFRQVLNPDL